MIIDRVRGSRAVDRRRRPAAGLDLPHQPLDRRQARTVAWARRAHPGVIPIAESVPGEIATVAGIVERVRIDPAERRLHAVIRDGTGELRASWRLGDTPTLIPGRGVLVRGRLRRTPWPEMSSPLFVLAPDEIVQEPVGRR